MDTTETAIDVRATLVELLLEASLELFAGYDVVLMPCEVSSPETFDITMIALIGLSDDCFRASLNMSAATQLLKNSFQANDDEISEENLQDWIGELANQLSGRLKNKIVPYGRKLELGVPTVIKGQGLSVDIPKSSISSKHQFVSEQGHFLEINFSTLIKEGFVLNQSQESQQSAFLEEGEMLFF